MTTNCLRGKKVLVLGASGQVGRELLKQLEIQDCEVTAIRLSKWTKKNDSTSNFNYLSLDINTQDSSKLKNLINDHQYIFHLAGDTEVQSIKDKERDYFLSWIIPLQSMLDSMVKSEKVLVFASSCSVYGNYPKLPVDENTIENPLTSYDLAKVVCDNFIRYYRDKHGVNCSSLRFSNIYGPSAISESSSRKVINKILDKISKEKKIKLVQDGKFLRNYIHVYDCAAMLIHAAKEIKSSGSVLLACSNENYMFKEVISKLVEYYQDKFNKKIEIKYGKKERFITDLRQFSGMPSYIFQKDFIFKYDLDKGLKELVNEFKEY